MRNSQTLYCRHERVSFSLLTWTFIKFFNNSSQLNSCDGMWRFQINSNLITSVKPANNQRHLRWWSSSEDKIKCNQWVGRVESGDYWDCCELQVHATTAQQVCEFGGGWDSSEFLTFHLFTYIANRIWCVKYSRNIKKAPTITTKSSMRMELKLSEWVRERNKN